MSACFLCMWFFLLLYCFLGCIECYYFYFFFLLSLYFLIWTIGLIQINDWLIDKHRSVGGFRYGGPRHFAASVTDIIRLGRQRALVIPLVFVPASTARRTSGQQLTIISRRVRSAAGLGEIRRTDPVHHVHGRRHTYRWTTWSQCTPVCRWHPVLRSLSATQFGITLSWSWRLYVLRGQLDVR